jgi:V/A-type H+-transporting ATPase subunit E
MVLKYAVGQSGSIIFSETDKKRLPQDFQAKIQTTLANIPGASLTISDRAASIDGGFILVYGEVEENCSFDAIFSASKDMLQDKVSGILFE